MKLSRTLADELVAHANDDLPNECCGMIAGRDGIATRVLRTSNSEGSPFLYVMEPQEQMRLMDEIDAAGEDLLAIYHSHTRSTAYPSRTDVELAFYSEPLYVIVSLADQANPDIRGFKIARGAPDGEQIAEQAIQIS